MIITTLNFKLQPADNIEAAAIRDAIDMAIDAGDSTSPTAIPDLMSVRVALGSSPAWPQWPIVDGALVGVELGPDALELVGLALRLLADWRDDRTEEGEEDEDEGLTSTEIRELAGAVDAWLLTSATVPVGTPK